MSFNSDAFDVDLTELMVKHGVSLLAYISHTQEDGPDHVGCLSYMDISDNDLHALAIKLQIAAMEWDRGVTRPNTGDRLKFSDN